MNETQFEVEFEARLRDTLHRALAIAEQGAVAVAALSGVCNFLLSRGTAAGEIAALLRNMADEIDDHADDELRPSVN